MLKRRGKRKRNERIAVVGAASLIVILIVYAWITTAPDYIVIPTHTPLRSLDVPQFASNTNNFVAQWFIHLDIFINGTKVIIPADLGHISNGFLYAINTYDTSGVIHIETPTYNSYNLSNIFEIWGYPTFTSTQIFTYSGVSISIYVNGTRVAFSPNTFLPCHTEFALIVGTSPHSIPGTYTFGSTLPCIA